MNPPFVIDFINQSSRLQPYHQTPPLVNGAYNLPLAPPSEGRGGCKRLHEL